MYGAAYFNTAWNNNENNQIDIKRKNKIVGIVKIDESTKSFQLKWLDDVPTDDLLVYQSYQKRRTTDDKEIDIKSNESWTPWTVTEYKAIPKETWHGDIDLRKIKAIAKDYDNIELMNGNYKSWSSPLLNRRMLFLCFVFIFIT